MYIYIEKKIFFIKWNKYITEPNLHCDNRFGEVSINLCIYNSENRGIERRLLFYFIIYFIPFLILEKKMTWKSTNIK